MIAHKAEAQDLYVKSKDADCDVIHPRNEIFTTLEDVVFLQPMTAYMIISLHDFFARRYASSSEKQVNHKKHS